MFIDYLFQQSLSDGPNLAAISLKAGLWLGSAFQQACIRSTNKTAAGFSCEISGSGGFKKEKKKIN